MNVASSIIGGGVSMFIQTTRFGKVTLENADVLAFPEGILGFASLRNFVLLDDPHDEIFAWLQSCERPEVAFPVLEPELFAQKFAVNLSKSDMEALTLKAGEKYRVFCIITIPEDVTQMTANLKAPIIINVASKGARQCVLQDNDLPIREMIFAKLQQRMVHALPIKSQATDWGVAVRLPELPANSITVGPALEK